MPQVKLPLNLFDWEMRDGDRQYPPAEWRGNTAAEPLFPEDLVLVMAWVDGNYPRTVWARRK
jgi:hypothetical protein